MADATNAAATPRMVTECTTLRGSTRQNRPAIIAAARGSSGMASRRSGERVVTRSSLQCAQVFDVDAATLAEQHHEDGESDGGLRRGDGQHEEHENLPVDVAEVARERHEVE